MLLPSDNKIDISVLYPIHYQKCKQSLDIIFLANDIIYKFSKKMEKRLKRFTFSDGVSEEYATEVLNFIHVTYEIGILNLLNSKKSPYSLTKLYNNMVQHLLLDSKKLNIKEKDFIITITYDTMEHIEEYNKIRRYKPFLQSYLPLLFPPYYTIIVNVVYINEIKDFNLSIVSYKESTIKELETVTYDNER